MKSTRKLLLLISFFLFPVVINAKDSSIQWQQVELEDKLKETFSQYLSLHLEKDKFFVHMKMKTKEQSFSLPGHDIKFKGKGRKFIEKNIPSSLNADLIALDKIGVFAPEYDRKDNSEIELKFFQYKNKLERDLIKKTNVFEFIDSIVVNVAVDSSIDKVKFNQVKKNLEKITPQIGKIKFNIETYQVNFKNNNNTNQSFIGKMVKESAANGSSLGLIFATIIFSITLIILFSKYKKLQEIISADRSQVLGDSVANSMDNKEVVDNDFRPGSSQLAEAITDSPDGISRFALYLEKSPIQTINLVKKWINLGTNNTKSALYVITERLMIEELTLIFNELTIGERESLNQVSNLKMSQGMSLKAEKFISQQVLEDILHVTHDIDKDLQQMLVELTPGKAASISAANPEIGSLLVNLMGIDFISEMMKLLSEEDLNEVSIAGLNISNDEITSHFEKLKEVLAGNVSEEEDNSFGRRMVELLGNVDVEQESQLISVLVKKGKISILKDFSAISLPSCLAFEIDETILKRALYSFDLKYKVEFLASLSDELKLKVLNKISQDGTKGREVLEHEINTLVSDDAKIKIVKENSDIYFNTVVKQIRSYVLKLPNSDEVLRSMSKEWINQISGEAKSLQGVAEAA